MEAPLAPSSRPHWVGAIVGAVLPWYALTAGYLLAFTLGAWARARELLDPQWDRAGTSLGPQADVLAASLGLGDPAREVLGPSSPTVFVVAAIALLATAGCSMLLGLAGLGRRVPAGLAVLLAASPWLAGVGISAVGQARATAALATAGGAGIAAFSAGIVQAIVPWLVGARLSAPLLAATGLALGAAALAQRASGRRQRLGALIGAVCALPMVVVALAELPGTGSSTLLAVAVAGALLLALPLAGAGAGCDPPHLRSAALAAATPVPLALSLVAAAQVVQFRTAVDTLTEAVLSGGLTAAALARLSEAGDLGWLAAPAALVPMVALAAWAYSRIHPRSPRWAGVALLLTVGTLTLAGGVLLSRPPWPLLQRLSMAHQHKPASAATEGAIAEPPSAEMPRTVRRLSLAGLPAASSSSGIAGTAHRCGRSWRSDARWRCARLHVARAPRRRTLVVAAGDTLHDLRPTLPEPFVAAVERVLTADPATAFPRQEPSSGPWGSWWREKARPRAATGDRRRLAATAGRRLVALAGVMRCAQQGCGRIPFVADRGSTSEARLYNEPHPKYQARYAEGDRHAGRGVLSPPKAGKDG